MRRKKKYIVELESDGAKKETVLKKMVWKNRVRLLRAVREDMMRASQLRSP